MATDTRREERLWGPLEWAESRLHLGPFIAALLHVRIPRDAKTFYLGGITLFLFVIQVITGTLLALYYSPTPGTAYESVLAITSEVEFGWLIRSIHHWAANLMIISLVLHMLRIFFQAAYKFPRELTWIVGGGMFGITILFGFTGYLLPWDQRAYWATTVGTEIAGAVPLIGQPLLLLLRGGPDVTDATLTRFFGIHVLVLPLMLAELTAWYAVMAAIVILASLFPAGLEAKADPLLTPEHIKPEWYFLGIYELLKYVPRDVGIIGPMVLVGIIILLPLLDRNQEVRPRRRPIALACAFVLLVGLGYLTIVGGR